MSRPRNNLTRLTLETRLRVCELLDDGATYDEIRDDEIVAAECADKRLKLHNATFKAYREGVEFREYRKRNREWRREMTEDRVAAAFIRDGRGPESLADMADYELLRICVAKLRDGDELEPKELSSISRAVASFQRNRLSADKEDAKQEFAERESEYQARIAELSAKVAELSTKLSNPAAVDTSKVADDLDVALGVR